MASRRGAGSRTGVCSRGRLPVRTSQQACQAPAALRQDVSIMVEQAPTPEPTVGPWLRKP